ncbi:MAG: hypothetical protein IPI17_17780 [Nitrosomonas sp.]|nr:hypothetical protein [Nitrosomonas sp.]
MMYERVKISDAETIEIRNNALAATRIAYLVGANKIMLLGFDPERKTHAHTGFRGLKQGLEQITAELLANGVVVGAIDSGSSIQEQSRLAGQRLIRQISQQKPKK